MKRDGLRGHGFFRPLVLVVLIVAAVLVGSVGTAYAVDYTITVVQSPGGAIDPAGPLTLPAGSSQSFSMTPDIGYILQDVQVNGVSVGAVDPLVLSDIQMDYTVSATFIALWTITPDPSPTNGTITPSVPETVLDGGSSSVYTITPNPGFGVASIWDGATPLVGTPVGDGSWTYQFQNVTADHSLSAIFVTAHTITASAGPNGTITPSGAVSVNDGADQTFTFTPATGYHVETVTVDGLPATVGPSYTFTNVTGNHTIAVTFEINTYTLTYTAGANGTITGTTPQTVNHGASGTQVTAVPNTGYHFVSWSDGVLTAARTDSNVVANLSVTANFAINTYTLTYTAGANGTITGTTPQTVNHGASGTQVTAVPNTGYHFVSWSDGVLTAARTDSNVVANLSVTANFAVDPPTTKPVGRLGGSNRYDVTVATAQSAFPGWAGVKHVVLASGEDRAQPDALTAAGLAGVLDAPLMLVPYSSLNDQVKSAILAMPAGVTVHIVGGTSSVSTSVEKQLRALATVKAVDRTSGSNRYGTASAVARRMKSELVGMGKTLPNTVLLTNGNISTAMFDALTASAISAHNFFPVLLVKDNAVPGETASALADLGLSNRYIIGGTVSVKPSVASALGVSSANRIAGSTRFSTATTAAIKAKAMGWLSNKIVGFAAKIPDAATGGAYMGKMDGALVYVVTAGVPADTSNYITAAKSTIDSGVVFGGTSSVPESVRTQLQNLLK